MRIVSSFHDYYDSAQGYGQDPNLVYRRKVELREFNRWNWDAKVPALLSKRPGYARFGLFLGVLGFCDRIYPVWLQERFQPSIETLSTNVTERYWMTEAEVDAYCEATGAAELRSFVLRRHWQLPLRLAPYSGVHIDDGIFRELDAPTFLVFRLRNRYNGQFETTIFTNPRLATLGFAHHVDPFSAFQDIAIYLGSRLTAADSAPRTVGNDKAVAAAKGFDEGSFRNPSPGPKKLNRQMNRERKKARANGD